MLQPLHHLPQQTPAPDALGRHHNYSGQGNERGEESQLCRRVLRRSREEHRQQDKRGELGQRTRGHDQTAEVRLRLFRVVEDGHQDPEGRRHQRDPHEQAIPDLAAQPESVGDQESQHRGNSVSPPGQDQEPAVEAPQVDLVAGHEQQETQAQVGHHLDGHVEVHPPQNRRSDQDPAEDLQHHRWQLHSRNEPEQQGHRDGDHADDQQASERNHDSPGKCCWQQPGAQSPARQDRRHIPPSP